MKLRLNSAKAEAQASSLSLAELGNTKRQSSLEHVVNVKNSALGGCVGGWVGGLGVGGV